MADIEYPVKTSEACRILGIGSTKMAAIKRALGLSYSHSVFVSQLTNFLRENPGFRSVSSPLKGRQAPGKAVRPPKPAADGTAD